MIEARLFGRVSTPPRTGRFVLLERVGEGAMGTVWAAYDPALDRKVALKFMHGAATDAKALARVRREAVALAQLDHPNVVTVHEVGDDGARLWVAMDFVERSVAVRCRERSGVLGVPFAEALGIAIDAATGLAAVHAARLVHRDIKPSNLLLSASGRVLVADFGLARAEDTKTDREPIERDDHGDLPVLSTTVTNPDEVIGTPAYMPPEQIVGRADARSDQFALCCTLWEVAYGVRPFAGRTLAERMVEIERGQPLLPAGRTGVPTWFRRALARGLAASPGSRWPDVATLLAVLERGRARMHRRPLLVAGAVLGAGVVSAWALVAHQEATRCDDGAAQLAPAWSEVRRAALADVPTAVLDTVDAAARDWIGRYERACRGAAPRDRAAGDDPLARPSTDALLCLAEAREAIAVVNEGMTASPMSEPAALPVLADCDGRYRVHDVPAAIRYARIEALIASGRIDEAEAAIGDPAIDPTSTADVDARRALARAAIASVRGDMVAAAELAHLGLEVAERVGDRRLETLAWVRKSQAARALGQTAWASFFAENAVSCAASLGVPSLASASRRALLDVAR